jgi:ACS family D-galactonate transporter-like MFS transporter
MLFVTVAINYLDRGNLGVAAPRMAGELGIDPVHLGILLSAFGSAYALFQIPGGWLVDRVGPRPLYAAACGLWSLATLAQGLASSLLVLVALRLLVGLFEAPAFPLCNRLATTWFPEGERAGTIGLYTSGQYVGLGFLTPLLITAQDHFGWRAIFLITGGLGLAWAGLWLVLYRDPDEEPGLSKKEREHIRAGGGLVDAGGDRARALRFNPGDLRFALTQRRLWGLYIGQFAINTIPWFFLTWFPTYLVTYRHVELAHSRLSTALPFLAAFVGVISAGAVSDLLVRRGVSPSLARKGPIIAGLVLSTSVIGANFVTDPHWVIFFMTVGFFGSGFSAIAWVMVSLMAPRPLIGLVGGIFNFSGALASVFVPLLIGVIVKYGGFAPALAFVSVVALCGALSYLFLVGGVERIKDPPRSPSPG